MLLVVYPRAAQLMQPCDGEINHPTGLVQAPGATSVAARDLGVDPVFGQGVAMGIGVIAAVGLDHLRPASRACPGRSAIGRMLSRSGSICVTSWRSFWVRRILNGTPCAFVRWRRFEPGQQRSVGFGSVFFPRPRLHNTLGGVPTGNWLHFSAIFPAWHNNCLILEAAV